jgi:hypothetical protein
MAEVLVDQFLASYATPPESIVLDFDATDDPVPGHQAGRFFRGYYDHDCISSFNLKPFTPTGGGGRKRAAKVSGAEKVSGTDCKNGS